ncbi:hypothetical protein HLH33_13790 [Gluconacetobacter diazotrophicus]|uniref:Uncharacterized protein n=1 Tax=Gluconacetobacter diazotrophicus TaxID=33996 RepID=A0A7W4I6X7_GLUDI|nr:hypothetical protein [Gluconacetobacter diazotrophicus]MBB2157371.1 hypothetical protein [Gluconacetobacter diazotrophicus]
MRISVPVQDAQPFTKVSPKHRRQLVSTLLVHIRGALARGPHSVAELLVGLSPQEAGALAHVVQIMIDAGETVTMGHGVYTAVPWTPTNRRVETDPVQDLVLSAIALIRPPTAERIALWLALPRRTVSTALNTAEAYGIIIYNSKNTHYRFASAEIAKLYRGGAAGRVFADVSPKPLD